MSKKINVVKTVSVIKSYVTRSISFEVEMTQDNANMGGRMSLIGEYLPEKKKVLINHLTDIFNQHMTLEQLMLISGGLASLVDIIKQKENLRELAEGSSDSIQSHKKKVGAQQKSQSK
jgi:hypothetical protein